MLASDFSPCFAFLRYGLWSKQFPTGYHTCGISSIDGEPFLRSILSWGGFRSILLVSCLLFPSSLGVHSVLTTNNGDLRERASRISLVFGGISCSLGDRRSSGDARIWPWGLRVGRSGLQNILQFSCCQATYQWNFSTSLQITFYLGSHAVSSGQ